jgi:hypothetical protein
VKVTSDFGHTSGSLLHGKQEVGEELKEIADFFKVKIILVT